MTQFAPALYLPIDEAGAPAAPPSSAFAELVRVVGETPSVPAISVLVPCPLPKPTLPEELLLEAGQQITLRCGKSSITLHASGKIVLHGEYILSDAECVNRLAGGQIELN